MLNGLLDIDNRLDYLPGDGGILPSFKRLVPYQIMGQLSFMRCPDMTLACRVPDAKTIGLFRSKLKAHKLTTLFDTFNGAFDKSGFAAERGQFVYAVIVRVPT